MGCPYWCSSQKEITCACYIENELHIRNRFCKSHFIDHYFKYPNNKHDHNFQEFDKFTEMLGKNLNYVGDSLESEKKVIDKKINKKYKKCVQQVENSEIRLKEYIRCIENDEPFENWTTYLTDLAKSENNIIKELKTWKKPDLKLYNQDLILKLNLYLTTSYEFILNQKLQKIMLFVYPSIKNNTLEVLKYDFEYQASKVQLNSKNNPKKNLTSPFSVCTQISDDLIFCGYSIIAYRMPPKINNYLIYSALSESYLKLKRIKNDCRFLCAAVYLNNNIFVFGGAKAKRDTNTYESMEMIDINDIEWLKSIIKFNLNERKGKIIECELEVPSETTACVVDSEIIITGYSMEYIYSFNPDMDKELKNTEIKLESNQRKFLFAHNETLFLIRNQTLCEINLKNKTITRELGNLNLPPNHIHNYAISDGFVFLGINKEIWKFNLKNLYQCEIVVNHFRDGPMPSKQIDVGVKRKRE